MTVSIKKSLQTQFALWTFLATGLLVSLVLVAYVIFSYRLFLRDYEQEIEGRMEIVAVSLKSMVNQTDYLGMMWQANSLLVTKGVVGVRILDVNKQPLIRTGSADGLLLQQPILHNKEQIGTIQVVFSNTPIKEKVKSLFLLGLLITLFGVPLSAILMWIVSGRQLKDILALSQGILQIGDVDSEDIILPGMKRQDEIGHLAQALAERHVAIREAKKQEQLLYYAINQSFDSVMITDAGGKIEYVNPAFCRITGYSWEESIARNPSFLKSGKHPAAFYKGMWDTLAKGKAWTGLIINHRKNGEEYQEEATITPVTDLQGNIHHYVAMKRDVTQEVILERKLARAEKMQAIGLMAGGVAHDLNNILSGIVGYPELLLMQLEKNSKLREPLEAIHDSGQRAATVVADLLTVARGAAAKREDYNLNSLALEYLNSPECSNLKALYPNVSYRQQLDARPASILCSSVHIKKCLMNLVINAAEAITGTGAILVSSRNQYVNKAIGFASDIKEGDYIVLSVEDNGPGISEEDLEHVFEPFYTRKVMGRSGSGLGLAVVWNSVQDHDGTIQVESSSEGTCFQLYFPYAPEKDATLSEKDAVVDCTGNGEHILVVDDEPHLRDIAGQMLTTLGYKVDSVSSGELAIEFVKEKPVDLLVIDMIMEPGMNGHQTYAEIIKMYPDQKAIIASGFSKSNDVKAALKLGAGSFFKKPYSLDQLGLAVKNALDG